MILLSPQQVARALGGDASGNKVSCPGPGHTPQDRSLSITIDTNAPGGFLVHSHAGDDDIKCKDYVREKLGLAPFKANGTSAPAPSTSRSLNIVASYDYRDEAGELLFQVCRLEPKDFRQRKPNGTGWTWKLGDTRRVLYRLGELREAIAMEQIIFIVEGEKAADALAKLGMPVTCSPGGAGKWREDYAEALKGADVVILPDNDEPGEGHANQVAASLKGVAARVRVARLPGMAPKEDVFDWIKCGGTAEQLWQLVEMTPEAIEAPQGDSLIMRCTADIEPEPVDWLWEGRLARGKLSVIGGDPEEGKSQIGVYIAAKISNGGAWPNNEGEAPPGSIIILSAEDGAEDTLIPRLIAAGADRSKIHVIDAVRLVNDKGRRTFNLQTDLQLLEAKLAYLGDVAAVIIDPASAYLGSKIDSHNDQSVRGVLAPVAEMASRLAVAIVSIMHFNKGNSQHGTKVMHRFMASIAFIAAARIAFAAIRDPDNDKRHLFLHAKNNLAEPAPGLAYQIEQEFVTEARIKTSRIVWDAEAVSITAAEAMTASKAQDTAPTLEEAKQFLVDIIGCDGMGVKEIEKEARAAGLSWATVRRAKDALKLKSERDGYGGPWLWKRP